MEDAPTTNTIDALTSSDIVSIASLHSAESLASNLSIKAVVSLLWPYSTSTRSSALLLAEPDFRRRNNRGQIRVQLRGAAAQALAAAHIAIGDHVHLCLLGSQWVESGATVKTPGKSVEGELLFKNQISLLIQRDGVTHASVNVQDGESPIAISPSGRVTTPVEQNDATLLSPEQPAHSKLWNTPTPFRNRFGANDKSSPDQYDLFGDPEAFGDRPAKRMKFGHSSGRWKYVARRSESPEEETLPSDQVKFSSPLAMGPPILPRLQTETAESSVAPFSAQRTAQGTPPDSPRLHPVQSAVLPIVSPLPSSSLPGSVDMLVEQASSYSKQASSYLEQASSYLEQASLYPEQASFPLEQASLPLEQASSYPEVLDQESIWFSSGIASPLADRDQNASSPIMISSPSDRPAHARPFGVENMRDENPVIVDSNKNSKSSAEKTTELLPTLTTQPSLDTTTSQRRVGVIDLLSPDDPAEPVVEKTTATLTKPDGGSTVSLSTQVDKNLHSSTSHIQVSNEAFHQAPTTTGQDNQNEEGDTRVGSAENVATALSSSTGKAIVQESRQFTPEQSQEIPPVQETLLYGHRVDDILEEHLPPTPQKSLVPSDMIFAPTDPLETPQTINQPLTNFDTESLKALSNVASETAHKEATTFLHTKASPLPNMEPHEGWRTAISYYSALSLLDHHVNNSSQSGDNLVDVIAVVSSATSDPQRSKSGPKDFFTTLHMTDVSISPNTLQVQVFRPYRMSLPVADVGDIILLRNFMVKRLKGENYLLSGSSSAWCVWKQEQEQDAQDQDVPMWAQSTLRNKSVLREERKGPPVEIGIEEQECAQSLKKWWDSTHQMTASSQSTQNRSTGDFTKRQETSNDMNVLVVS